MCFDVKKSEHIKYMAEIKRQAKYESSGKDAIYVYKIVKVKELEQTPFGKVELYSPIYGDKKWKFGTHSVSNPDSLKWEKSGYSYSKAKLATINKAFHAYRTRQYALSHCDSGKAIITLKVELKDIISANEKEVVFHKCSLDNYFAIQIEHRVINP